VLASCLSFCLRFPRHCSQAIVELRRIEPARLCNGAARHVSGAHCPERTNRSNNSKNVLYIHSRTYVNSLRRNAKGARQFCRSFATGPGGNIIEYDDGARRFRSGTWIQTSTDRRSGQETRTTRRLSWLPVRDPRIYECARRCALHWIGVHRWTSFILAVPRSQPSPHL
jgi:hypothetical protein